VLFFSFVAEEVQSLCQALLKFGNDKEASGLQQLLSDLIQDMDSSKHEIWTSDLMQQPQMVRQTCINANLGYIKVTIFLVMLLCR
jgi:hypothetical protein